MRVIIPMKPFAEAKQRLAPALDPGERAKLAERMFRHVLRITSGVFGAPNVLVVSRARDVVGLAEAGGANGLLETGVADLNSALAQAACHVSARGESRVLIVASDLPLLGEQDIAEMAKWDCAITPDRHQCGTNALVWPVDLPLLFGNHSFARHHAAAEGVGLVAHVVVRRGLSHDVDVPADLAFAPE